MISFYIICNDQMFFDPIIRCAEIQIINYYLKLHNLTQCQICVGYPLTSQSEPQGPGTSKLDWRYFDHHKIDRNELQVRISLQKGTGTKMIHFFLSNCSIYQSFLFLCLYANRCEPGVHSYQFYYIQSTSSPILKSLVP